MKRVALFLGLGLVLIACTTETVYRQETAPNESVPTEYLGLGAVCTTTNRCAEGFKCFGFAQNGECTDQKGCSVECTKDSECTALDPRGLCSEGCDGARICILTIVTGQK